MEWYWAAILMLGLVFGTMALGLPVAVAFMTTNMIGVYIFMGGTIGIEQLVDNASDSLSSFLLVTVPLFIMMGEVFFHTGVASNVFDALDKLFGAVRGRLSYVAVAGGTLFAALSGSAMANTAMMGSLMVPEMMRRGYKSHMAMGPIQGSAGLAILIPPSALGVLLGSLAEINISALLIAGIVPGLVLAAMYIALVAVQVRIDPQAAPSYDVPYVAWGERLWGVVVNVLPMGLVIFFVIGFMMLGIATPTEAAAFGVLGAIILAVVYQKFTWAVAVKAMTGTLRVSVMVFFIILASTTFSQIFAFSGATAGAIKWALSFDLAPILMVVAMFAIILVLGCFIDGVSILLITLPVFMPLAKAIGYDQIWFGVVMLIGIEMGGLTPPFGLQLFVMQAVAPKGTRFEDVVRSAIPYLGCNVLIFFALLAFPALALWLPSVMAN
ncbi:MAG: TRAP transporter large permease [Alphaproteobacteria bacterium]|nr:TRAP transporter large permease [Alphaproteobacteria bacterium]